MFHLKSLSLMPGFGYLAESAYRHYPVQCIDFKRGSQKWQRKQRRRAHAAGCKKAFRR